MRRHGDTLSALRATADLATSASGRPNRDVFNIWTTGKRVARASLSTHPLVAAALGGTLDVWSPGDVLFVLQQQRDTWANEQRRRGRGEALRRDGRPCGTSGWRDVVEWVERCEAPELRDQAPRVLWRMSDGDLGGALVVRESGRVDGWALRLIPYYTLAKGGALAVGGDHARDPATVPRQCATVTRSEDEDGVSVSAMVGLAPDGGAPVYGTCAMRSGMGYTYAKRRRAAGGEERSLHFTGQRRRTCSGGEA
jgi:hypothetical protein